MASSRLPNKPLILIQNKTMIQRVYEQAVKTGIKKIIIACDGDEIAKHVKGFDAEFVITDPNLKSGTDRIYEAYKKLNLQEDYILNLQGDLPNIDPNCINACLDLAYKNQFDITTIASKINNKIDIENPNIVKIAIAKNNQALYFSRSAIPYSKDLDQTYYHHIGIYAYTKNSLKNFINFEQSYLEKRESLEQLRALENNLKIGVKIVDTHPLSVDTAEDLEKIKLAIKP